MKIRDGFISNSSTTSFCIYGAFFSGDEWEDILGEEGLKKKLSEALEIYYDPEGYGTYIGRSWDSIEDNETGLQFKEAIKRKLDEILGKDTQCDTHSEAYRDG